MLPNICRHKRLARSARGAGSAEERPGRIPLAGPTGPVYLPSYSRGASCRSAIALGAAADARHGPSAKSDDEPRANVVQRDHRGANRACSTAWSRRSHGMWGRPCLSARPSGGYPRVTSPRQGEGPPAPRRAPLIIRAFRVLRREGLPGVLSSIKERLPYYGAYVVAYDVPREPAGDSPPQEGGAAVPDALERARRVLKGLEFKELTAADQAGVSALTAVDPFNAKEKLADGWRCFVPIWRGKTAASSWTNRGPEFHEPFMDRPLRLAPGEVYDWRTFCVPELRGLGLAPMLARHVTERLAAEEGLYTHLGWVATTNHRQIRTLTKTGFRFVGRMGFLEAFGFRFQYLLGREAFKATERRVFVQRAPRRKAQEAQR